MFDDRTSLSIALIDEANSVIYITRKIKLPTSLFLTSMRRRCHLERLRKDVAL